MDSSGRNAEAMFWGVISTLLMIASVLLGFGEANLVSVISRAARDVTQLRSMYSIGEATLKDLLRSIDQLKDLERTSRRLRVGAKRCLVASLIARALMIRALVIDCDIAPSGHGGLETVFGEQ